MPEKDAQEIKSCDICPKKLEILEKQGSRLGQKDCKNVCGGRARMICKPVSYTHLTLPTKA